VFEGLFSPWHIVIIAVTLFIVLGPQKLADRWKGTTGTISQWIDGEDDGAAAAAAPVEPPPPPKPSLAQRLGRRLQRLRRRGR
jgi:hypothetical protein